jgi:hypothetical protein
MLLSLTPTKRNLKEMDCRFEVVDAPDGLAVEGSLVSLKEAVSAGW